MLRSFPLRPAALALLVLLPALPLALLCRGRTPSRLDAGNIPAWQRQASTPAPVKRVARKHGAWRAAAKRKADS